METKYISLASGQHLSDIFPEGIPSNVILHKTLCGIGATTLEINAPRHSIIIEPNVPVIKGKTARHPEVLGVFEGISKEQIADYINSRSGFCKIMTTPESFMRVRQALLQTRLYLSRDFFLLFDECEKLVQDVEFRSRITLPVNLFFQCQKKAMVSATPIIPSDPRYEKQGFELLKVVPSFSYKKPLNLFQTNNVFTLFSFVLQNIPAGKKICVFFNSTSGITKLIEREHLQSESAIFCSEDAASRLRSQGYTASENLTMQNGTAVLPRVSFFTSRFFSAVDILLPEGQEPVVIILTELYTAPHSMIDPRTETTQIIGRFRNGVHNAYHIMNNNPRIETRTDEELEEYLAGAHKVYHAFYLAYEGAETEGESDTLKQALETVDYARFVYGDCEKNTFMYDNAYNEEHIKALYKEYDAVHDAYMEEGAFEVNWKQFHLKFSDEQRKLLETPQVSKTRLNRLAFRIIQDLIKKNGDLHVMQLHELSERFSLIINAYQILGPDKILEIGFKDQDLTQAVAVAQSLRKERAPGVIAAVRQQFNEDTWYSTNDINNKLRRIFDDFHVDVDRRGIARKIQLYFDAHPQDKRNARGWFLGKRQ